MEMAMSTRVCDNLAWGAMEYEIADTAGIAFAGVAIDFEIL